LPAATLQRPNVKASKAATGLRQINVNPGMAITRVQWENVSASKPLQGCVGEK